MAELKDIINQLSDKQYDQFQSSISDVLMDRLKDRIENEKYAVGQSIFADQDTEIQDDQLDDEDWEQQEETSDEEV
jgi:hypothetical protein